MYYIYINGTYMVIVLILFQKNLVYFLFKYIDVIVIFAHSPCDPADAEES